MSSPAAGGLRLLRAGGLTVAAYALASVAHVQAGGGLPTWPWLAAILLLTFWGAVVLTGRRLGRVATVAGLGVSQLVLHEAFGFLSPVGACLRDSFVPAGHAGHEVVLTCADPGLSMPAHHGRGLTMVVAHAVAAALTGLVLARGEDAVWFLASLVWPALPSPVRPAPPESRLPVSPRPRSVARQVVCSGGPGRRGPPPALPAAAH
jgi:hypothetical protein